MQEQLNVSLIEHKMQELGLNVPALAKALGVSREIVYNWLKSEKQPQPKNILGLTRTLKIPFKELFLVNTAHEPVIAFRKKAGTKTTDEHIENAVNIGKALEPLAPYMGFSKHRKPSTLISPSDDYLYIQEAAKEFRTENDLRDIIEYEQMIGVFKELHAVLIPVLWGNIKSHENALHIYLPKSATTWVFLNLDTHPFDFKFWMAHEIGHILSPELRGDAAENFADNFAGAVLFPMELAKRVYDKLPNLTDSQKIERIKLFATDYVISMWTVLGEVNKYAKAHNLPEIKLNIGGAVTNFNKNYHTVSESLFDGKTPVAADFIKLADEFESPFFNGLRAYLKEHRKSASIISRVLKMPAHDAQAIFEDLMNVAE